mgnify:CR=1 FL=1
MYESYALFIGGRWRQAADGIREREGESFGIREYLGPKTVKTVI